MGDPGEEMGDEEDLDRAGGAEVTRGECLGEWLGERGEWEGV